MTGPTMEGWMVRYGRRKIGRSFFHKRYFVLESLVLAYYKRQPSANETALRRSHLPLVYLRGHADHAIEPVGRCVSAPVASQSSRLGFASWSLSTRALSSGVSWTPQRGVHSPRNFLLPTFYSAFVRYQHYDTNGSTSGDTSAEGSSSSGSSAVQPLQPSHLQSSLVADDFRSLIVSRKREVAILEAALEILEIAPREKWFEDLMWKHNIQLEPFKVLVTEPEKRWKDPKSLSMLEAHSPKLVLGDLAVAKSNIEFEPASTGGPSLQIGGFSKVKNSVIEDDFIDLAIPSDSQQDRRWNTTQLSSSKVDSTMFDKLPLDDLPSPQDPNFERLQKKWRRQELMKAHERNNRIESLNFGDAAKSASNLREEESPVDPLRPNARAFLEQTDKKPYRSLADRLYEEQFGRPAPPGLKRTYPKGSFYDRCMKEKEQKERDAAAAAGPASSPFPPRSVSSPSSRSIESASSVSSQRDEASDNLNSKNVISNDTKKFSPLGQRQSM